MVSGEIGELKQRLKDTYQEVRTDHGPTEDQIKQALSTLLAAWDQVAESLAVALKDPDIRGQLKETASSFAAALGTTLSDIGEEIQKTEIWEAVVDQTDKS